MTAGNRCGGCFGHLPENDQKWTCFCSTHDEESGGCGFRGPTDQCWVGDSLDLEAHRRGVSRRDVLVADGYLARTSRIRQPTDPDLLDRSAANKKRDYLTDWGNAQSLVMLHGQDLRFCKPWKKWLTWDGHRFRVDDVGDIESRAKDVSLYWYSCAIDLYKESLDLRNAGQKEAAEEVGRQAGKALGHARACESAKSIQSSIRLAQSEPAIPVIPEDLDADLWSLNVHNCTIDLRTLAIRPHSRADLMTKMAGCAYDPRAEAPVWQGFLHRIFDGDQDLIAFVQRAAGWSLTGDVSEEVWFFCHGSGQNGKSKLVNALKDMLGDYAFQANSNLLLAKQNESHPTEIASLFGVRMALCVEPEVGRAFAEGRIKQLTGGDPINARRMHEDEWEFMPTFKIWLSANHKPKVPSGGGKENLAFWRRTLMIPFLVTIPEWERDRNLSVKLRAELPGILNWALEGLRDWHEGGLRPPKAVVAATGEFQASEDVIEQFIGEVCTTTVPTAQVRSGDLWRAYRAWCEEHGEDYVRDRDFGLALKAKGFEQCKIGKDRGWKRIGLPHDHRADAASGAETDWSGS